jgi:hypothetical protein
MPIELSYDNLDAVPEELRGDAKQNGTKFVVNVVSNKKLSEFRDNNIALSQERDTLKGKVGTYETLVGPDVEKFTGELTELRTIAQKVKDGSLKGSDAIEQAVQNRVKETKESYETQLRDAGGKLTSVTAERDTWKQKYEQSVLQQQITSAVVHKDSVANPEALADILARAERVFQVQPDGSVVPKKGETVIYGADGTTPMSAKEWLAKLVAEAPYLGKSSAGSGAAGNRAGDQMYGMSHEAFMQLDPAERIRRHREAQQKR